MQKWSIVAALLLWAIVLRAFSIEYQNSEIFQESPIEVTYVFLSSILYEEQNLRALVDSMRAEPINLIFPLALMDHQDELIIFEMERVVFPLSDLHRELLPCDTIYNRPLIANAFFAQREGHKWKYGGNLTECSITFDSRIHAETYLNIFHWIIYQTPKCQWLGNEWQWMVTWPLPDSIRRTMIQSFLLLFSPSLMAEMILRDDQIFIECIIDKFNASSNDETDVLLFLMVCAGEHFGKRHLLLLEGLFVKILDTCPRHLTSNHILSRTWVWMEHHMNKWQNLFAFWGAMHWACKVAAANPQHGSQIPLLLLLQALRFHERSILFLDIRNVFSLLDPLNIPPTLVEAFIDVAGMPNPSHITWSEALSRIPDSPYLPYLRRPLSFRLERWKRETIYSCCCHNFFIDTTSLHGKTLYFCDILQFLYENAGTALDGDSDLPFIQRHFTHTILFEGKTFGRYRELIIHFVTKSLAQAPQHGFIKGNIASPFPVCITSLRLIAVMVVSWAFLLWEGRKMSFDFMGLSHFSFWLPTNGRVEELVWKMSLLHCDLNEALTLHRIIFTHFILRHVYHEYFYADELLSLVLDYY